MKRQTTQIRLERINIGPNKYIAASYGNDQEAEILIRSFPGIQYLPDRRLYVIPDSYKQVGALIDHVQKKHWVDTTALKGDPVETRKSQPSRTSTKRDASITTYSEETAEKIEGMLKQLRVIEKSTEQMPPQETVGIKLSPNGIALDGEMPKNSGQVVFRVDYGETKLFENFTRPDVNLARVTDENGLALLEDYMDWSKPNGMTMEAPVTFLGGVQEMPEGNVSYFSANLEPGKYVLIGEVPEPKKDGFYLEFEIE